MPYISSEGSGGAVLLRRFCDLGSVRRAQELLTARPQLLAAPPDLINALVGQDPKRWYRALLLRAAARHGVAIAFDSFLVSEGDRYTTADDAIDALVRGQSPDDLTGLLVEAPGLLSRGVEAALKNMMDAATAPQDVVAYTSRRYLVRGVRRLGPAAGAVQANLMYSFLTNPALFGHLENTRDPEGLVPLLDFVGDLCSAETPLAEKAVLVTDPERMNGDALQLVQAMQQLNPPDEIAESLYQALYLMEAVLTGASAPLDALRSVTAGNVIAARTEELARRYAVEYVDVFGADDPGNPVLGREIAEDHPVEERFALIGAVAAQRYEYLHDTLSQLCAAMSVEEARAMLLNHPELLSPYAAQLMDLMADDARELPEHAAFIVHSRQTLLRESRELGLETALIHLSQAFAQRMFDEFAAERGATGPAVVVPAPEPGTGDDGFAVMMASGALSHMDEVLRGPAPPTPEQVDSIMSGLEFALAVAANARSSDLHVDLLNRQAFLLRLRFSTTGSIVDLDQATEALDTVLTLSAGRAGAQELIKGNLGDLLVQRYEATRDETDLGRALTLLNEVVREETTSSKPARVRRLLSLAHALFAVAVLRGTAEEMDTCVDTLERARTLLPDDLNVHQALGLALSARSGWREDPADMAQAIVHLRTTIRLAESPEQTVLPSYNLALCLIETGSPGDRAEARALLERVLASQPTNVAGEDSLRPSGLTERTTKQLAELAAADGDWQRSADLYRDIVATWSASGAQLLRAHTEAGLRRTAGVAACAAEAFIRADACDDAVEVLERSRATQLSASLRLDTAELDRLPDKKFVTEFEQHRKWLRAHERLEIGRANNSPTAYRSTKDLRDRQQRFEELLDRIRVLPGMRGFLTTPAMETVLGGLARPLVYLTHTESGGSALIVGAETVHIGLPKLTDQAVRERADQVLADPAGKLDEVTKWLWQAVMGPVLDALGTADHAVLVPTGLLTLLPLHAAWTPDSNYPTGRRHALDQLLLTYTPNAETLRVAETSAARKFADDVLVVDEPRPVSASPLPFSALERVAALRTGQTGVTLCGPEATRRDLLDILGQHAVTHLSCHAYADTENPLHSALLLAGDEHLTVADLISRRVTGTRLAVLSACETALIGTGLPDEVVGFPAALLQIGVPAVIGSLWSVPQASTAELMVHLYDGLCSGMSFAQSLRAAQQRVRDSTAEQKRAVLEGVAELALAHPKSLPHARPFHWAAFGFHGADQRL